MVNTGMYGRTGSKEKWLETPDYLIFFNFLQALLASEPKKSKTDLLKMTMKELISLAAPLNESPSVIPKVK